MKKLKLEPDFADYVGEAFKPLGVYLNFFQPTLAANTERSFTVKLINDEDRPADGELVLWLEDSWVGNWPASATGLPWQAWVTSPLMCPYRPSQEAGAFVDDCRNRQSKVSPTICRRWVSLE